MHQVTLAALAGLWHDVGKIAQRAGERGTRLPDEDLKRDFGCYHALLPNDAVLALAPQPWRDELAAAASGHHRPQTTLAAFVAVADFLSAGERAEEESNQAQQLQSIFSSLYDYHQPRYLPLKPFELDYLEPQPEANKHVDLSSDYAALWDGFQAEVRELPAQDIDSYLESFQNTLQRYAWCIPAAYYRSVPGISLYDHSRMTGALAACFCADGRAPEWALELRDQLIRKDALSDEPVACLVGGDLSGIQPYLYNTASSGATRSLCGRSFYLQLLTEAAALALLDAIGLPLTNLLYAGGGHFYLIIPAGRGSQEALAARYQRLVRSLLEAHEGKLALAVATLPLGPARFRKDAFSDAWRELGSRVNREKDHRLAALGEGVSSHIGLALGQGGHPDLTCLICGREGEWQLDEDGNRKCSFCASLEELGRNLGRARALALSTVPAEHTPVKTWEDGLRQLGVAIQVITPDNPSVRVPADAQFVRIWQYQADAPPVLNQGSVPVTCSSRFLPVLVPHMRDPDTGRMTTATFEHLANASSTAVKQWGVLRMDVDNLGKLFYQDIQNASLSRIASLSLQFRLFFEGMVPRLASRLNQQLSERQADEQDRIYLIYAGGDDLFAVGTWEVLPNLAHEIRQAFGRFVAENPHVTISGGIAVFPQKYPLYLAAQKAHIALDQQAKAYQRPNQLAKDALSFLGMTIGWEDYPSLMERVLRWRNWIMQKTAPRAVIQILQTACEGSLKASEGGKPQLGRMTWQMVYVLARRRQDAEALIKRRPQDEPALRAYIDELNRIETVFVQGQLHEQRLLALLARWTELLTRGGSQ